MRRVVFINQDLVYVESAARLVSMEELAKAKLGKNPKLLVGVVPSLISKASVDLSDALALVCGPEAMMRFAVSALLDGGAAPARVRLSMERSMKCGLGLCGHCQLRELFVCVDGPVFDYPRLAPLLAIREV